MARPLSASLFQHVLSDARSYYLALWEQLEPDARERLDAIMLPLLNQLGDAVYFKAVVTDRPYNPGLPQKVNHHDRHRNDMFTIEMHGEVLNIRGMQTLVDWTALTESYIAQMSSPHDRKSCSSYRDASRINYLLRAARRCATTWLGLR